MTQKHVLAIHDISCMGRCSLTIALPVISAAGITTSVMPTAVLSTHTGGFTDYTYRDLTEDMIPIADHWQTLEPSFDAIYSGYLGSEKQLDIVAEIIKRFKKSSCDVIIDPVMADHGRLYAGFSPDFPLGMAKLCESADIITPNITEALFMLNEPYKEGPYQKEYVRDILHALSCEKVVLTGVYFGDEGYGAAAYDNGDIHYAFAKRIPGDYHGTGDLFASVLTAALVSGWPLNHATDIAVEFTSASIKRTYLSGVDIKYGVNFEEGLAELSNMIRG